MTLKSRIGKLEAKNPKPSLVSRPEYTWEQLIAMPLPELLRMYREEIKVVPLPLNRQQRELSAQLAAMLPDQIEMLHREKMGAFAETRRRW